jgi:predicted metal-binding membrane protein
LAGDDALAAPMFAAHALERRKRYLGRAAQHGGTAAFVGGYLVAWTGFGVMAYALFELLGRLDAEKRARSDTSRQLGGALDARGRGCRRW